MLVENVFDDMSLAISYFLPENPSEELKQKVLDMFGLTDLSEKVILKFNLGSIIFDLVRQAIDLGIFATPVSPKLQYKQEKQFSVFAENADTQGQIDIPNQWMDYVDRILSDDDLFCQVTVYAEVSLPSGEARGAIPMKGQVLNALPQISNALLRILPQ